MPVNLAVDSLVANNVSIEEVVYQGREAIRLRVPDSFKGVNQGGCEHCTYAMVPKVMLADGSIELEVAGLPVENAPPWARGFVGVLFRVNEDRSRYEGIYLRPMNAVSESEEQRAHTVQYFSYPDFPWHSLRKSNPGKYEAYAAVKPGDWTRLRIDVKGSTASLYVNDSGTPVLVVTDLKLGSGATGGLGLYTEPATQAYFRNLVVTPAD